MEDALNAAEFGADAIGFVFYDKSPRYITVKKAAEIAESLPPFVSIVALFVNATDEEIRTVLDTVPVDILQFHGEESPKACQGILRRAAKRGKKLPHLLQMALERVAQMTTKDKPGISSPAQAAFLTASMCGGRGRIDYEPDPLLT